MKSGMCLMISTSQGRSVHSRGRTFYVKMNENVTVYDNQSSFPCEYQLPTATLMYINDR